MAHFIIKAGPDEGSLIPIVGDETSIGRSLTNHIVLNDAAASRSHALILKRENQYFLRDLGSTHGTSINGVRENGEHPLHDQDLIKIGATVLLFLFSDAQAEIEAPASPNDSTSPVRTVEGQTVLLIDGQCIVFSLLARPDVCESAQAGSQPPALTKIINATDSLLDRKLFLDTLVRQVFEVFTPDRGALLLRDKPDGPCLPFIMRPAHKEWTIGKTILDYVIEKRTAILMDNSSEGIAPREEVGAGSAQTVPSALCAPLVYRDSVLGLLYLDSCSGDVLYQKEDLVLLCRISTYAAASLQRIQLIQEKIEFERHSATHKALRSIAEEIEEIAVGLQVCESELEKALSCSDPDHARKARENLHKASADLSGFLKRLPKSTSPAEQNLLKTAS